MKRRREAIDVYPVGPSCLERESAPICYALAGYKPQSEVESSDWALSGTSVEEIWQALQSTPRDPEEELFARHVTANWHTGEDRIAAERVSRLALVQSLASETRQSLNIRRLAGRRVTLYSQKNGAVTGYRTGLEIQKGLNQGLGVAFEMQPGERPRESLCRKCGRPFKVRRKGAPAMQCDACRKGSCIACGAELGHRINKRCKPCHMAHMQRQSTLASSGKELVPRESCVECGTTMPLMNSRAARRRDKAPRCRDCYRASLPTQCQAGHLYDEDNTVLRNNKRSCRACHRERMRRVRARVAA